MMSLWSVLIPLCVAQIVCAVCPDGWIRRGKSCYLISTTLHQSGDSVIYCLTENATLAQVDDNQELEFLRKLVKRFPTAPASRHYYWIDGVRTHDNHWVRNLDRNSLTFFSWGTGEPKPSFGGENCLALYNHVDFFFADTSCHDNGQYICELSDPVQSCVHTTPLPTADTNGSWIPLG